MPEDTTQLKKAVKKLADYLSRRSYSLAELKLKLSKTFSINIVEKALQKAQQNQWLESPQELSKKVTNTLHNKNKSWNYIKNYLLKKKLPLPPYDNQKELAKAQNLLAKKAEDLKNLSFEQKRKLKLFLAYRGFEQNIVSELLD